MIGLHQAAKGKCSVNPPPTHTHPPYLQQTFQEAEMMPRTQRDKEFIRKQRKNALLNPHIPHPPYLQQTFQEAELMPHEQGDKSSSGSKRKMPHIKPHTPLRLYIQLLRKQSWCHKTATINWLVWVLSNSTMSSQVIYPHTRNFTSMRILHIMTSQGVCPHWSQKDSRMLVLILKAHTLFIHTK